MKFPQNDFKIAIFKPNENNYSETFIENQIKFLSSEKVVLFGGFFPTKTEDGKFLIQSPMGLFWYWVEKNLFKRKEIPIRNYYLSRFLKLKRISVVLANYGVSGALIWKSCAAVKVPLVIHFHGFDAHDRATITEFKSSYLESFKYASAIVVVSLVMKKSLIDLGAPQNKIHHIPYGVDLNFFPPVNPEKADLNFLSVARFAEKKSPDSTIKAFSKVLKVFPEAKLIMAGVGPLWEDAKSLSRALGIEKHIQFLGIQDPDQIREIMKNSRAFVQHSVTAKGGDMEGTPNSILEASGSGLPVVSTFHAGIPEAVIHNETGYLVPEGDVDKMASYMIALAGDPQLAREMGEKGRAHIREAYNLPVQIAKLESLLIKSS